MLTRELVQRGPVAVFVLQDDEHAQAFRELGANVAVAFPKGLPRLRARRWWTYCYRLREAIRVNDCKLIHSHSAQLLRYALPVSLWSRVPLICHQRELWEGRYQQIGLGHTHAIISISKVVEQSLPNNWRKKSTLIYNAVAGPDEVPARVKDARPLRIGVAGRVVRDKGQDLLVAALEPLLNKYEIVLEIWGMPPFHAAAPYATALVETANRLTPHVRLEPMREDMHTFYSRMDIVVVPSRWVEPMGRVAIESMAWGCCTVVAGHGGLSEVVDDGRTGLTFHPGDVESLRAALLTLINDPDLRLQLASEGRLEYERRFRSNAHCSAVLDVYRRVLSKYHFLDRGNES